MHAMQRIAGRGETAGRPQVRWASAWLTAHPTCRELARYAGRADSP
jgi:hypothetical protein